MEFSLHIFLRSPRTSSVLGPNIYVTTFLSITLYQAAHIHIKEQESTISSVTFLPNIYVAIGQTGTIFLCISRKLN